MATTDAQKVEKTPEVKTRKASRFLWEEVDANVVRAILQQVYAKEERFTDVDGLQRMSDAHIFEQAKITLGQPPKPKYTKQLVDVVTTEWLRRASAFEVKKLATMVQAGLTGEVRTLEVSTKYEAEIFLRNRRKTKNFVTNVRKAFIAAHKYEYRVKDAGGQPAGRRPAGIPLIGTGADRSFQPYVHQVEARRALDDYYDAGNGTEDGCLIVLPTGSGKTETLVEWLLEHLEQEPDVRVLWIAHQQELVDQSMSRFEALALSRNKEFRRTARAIHGRGSAVSTLGSDDLDVAGVTFQTLYSAAKGPKFKTIKQFFKRPVYIVVDEVHHAGAKSYRTLVNRLRGLKPRALIGLTATPAPTSMVNRFHLNKLFPDVVYEAGTEELIARGILSRPVLTTIHTNFKVFLDDDELKKAQTGDLPPESLRKLESKYRDNVIVRSWQTQAARWGKTLVFATRIEHAETLRFLFEQAGANVKSLHSLSENRRSILDWFRAAEDSAVLISVGMLTEGVDLPDARTAFLSRPTTSRVLLKQMIGRVMRGPTAGGGPIAEVVYFEDVWTNFLDILHPADAIPQEYVLPVGPTPHKESPLPVVVVDNNQKPISDKVLIQIEKQLRMASPGQQVGDAYRPMDATLYTSRLVGYYDLVETVVPVFAHQEPAYGALVADLLAREDSTRISALSYFEELHPPYPSKRALMEFVGYVREFGAVPEFHEFDAVLGPQRAADAIVEAGPLAEKDRVALIRKIWEASVVRAVYPTIERFEEAVERELRGRRRPVTQDPDDELPKTDPSLPCLPGADRELKPLLQETIQVAREILPSSKLELFMTDVPRVEWTKRVVTSSFGHWSIKLLGKNAGQQIIRVNRLLRAPKSVVPDNVICFIIYHELLHHLLPGQGHDAEFRELEMIWPDVDQCMSYLDTLHERYSFDRKKYRR